jgi:CubicO group peptidase (beta-lactamase class C family)
VYNDAMNKRIVPVTVFALLVLASGAQAQVEVRKEAPPEIRQLITAVVEAVNGAAERFEAFAQARFAPELLKKHSPADRAALHRKLSDTFGQIAVGAVRREGPDAPLQLQLKGSKSNGVIMIDVDSSAKILEFSPENPAPNQAGGVPRPPIDGSLASGEIDRRLGEYFTQLAAADMFSGVALVARSGVPVFFNAYGMADREKQIPNTVHTRFNLGSINKTFTQAAIRQLVAAGRLSMTDTIGRFFPDYPQQVTRHATIEQLLTHRAGVSDFFGPEFSSARKSEFASNADYFRFVSSRPPLFAPGERSQYCNGCYIALGAIIEQVSGMAYEKYVAENIFRRADMTSTGYPRSDRPEPDIALGYTRRTGDGKLRSNLEMHGVAGSAAGGGYSTAQDLLSYAKAVRAGTFPGVNPGLGIAGGAPGINAILENRGEWTVIVLTNFDPPTGQQVGAAIADALSR